MFKRLIWLWRNSTRVWEGKGVQALMRRLEYLMRSLVLSKSLDRFINAAQDSSLRLIMEARPEIVGAVIWPYQCAGWDAATRLDHIYAHYSVTDSIGYPLNVPLTKMLILLDLSNIRSGYHVILDRPKWFIREGELVINLFRNEERMFSLAFSCLDDVNGLVSIIGGIQGRDIEGALDEYREMTKATHGMRPRDFLIEIFRMFCGAIGVVKILAVADEYRHHRHPYFGQRLTFPNNYNDVWEERGGTRYDPMFFELPLVAPQRKIESIAAKKRAMYRRRYDMLHELRDQIVYNIQNAVNSSDRPK